MTATPTSAPSRVHFGDLVAAEWIKLLSLRSTVPVLLVGVLLCVADAVQQSLNTYNAWPTLDASFRAGFDPLHDALNGICVALVMIGAGTLGALSIVGEHSSGMIRTTFVVVPARRMVIAAKVAVMTTVTLAAGVVITAAAFLISQAILDGRGIGVGLGDQDVLRALAFDALLPPLCAVVGIGLGSVIRSTALSIVAVCVVLVVLPASLHQSVHVWADDAMNTIPYTVWQRMILLGPVPSAAHLPTVAGSWIVFAAWPLVAALIALVAVGIRDV